MFIDIAFNAKDKYFDGKLEEIIKRTKKENVIPFFVGTDYNTSLESITLADKYKSFCYIGIHPTSIGNFNDLIPFLDNERIVAVGECGLDFDRLNFTSKEDQKVNFGKHLAINADCYFFHCRNSYREFLEMVDSQKGVVHSFTGSLDDALQIIKKGLFIGINGCSLKTEESLEIVRNIPIDKILLETDAPYCKIRKSSSAYKYIEWFDDEKRLLKMNEPVTVKQVADVVSFLKGVDDLESVIEKNTINCFGEKVRKGIYKYFD